MVRKLLEAGMDVARLNFSHGSHEEHGQNIVLLREAAVALKKPLAILADLQGVRASLSEQGAQRVGKDYNVEPVAVSSGRAFHPKISVFSDQDETCLSGLRTMARLTVVPHKTVAGQICRKKRAALWPPSKTRALACAGVIERGGRLHFCEGDLQLIEAQELRAALWHCTATPARIIPAGDPLTRELIHA
jgi:hypothetical protein